jgi:hypothetical protein
VTSGGDDIDITVPPVESVWHSIDFNNLAVNPPVLAAGTTSTNDDGNALNISGRGKVESTQQVFHYVYASVSGNFTITARLDGVDFAGGTSNQARAGLLLTPDITATGNALIYGSTILGGNGVFARSHRLAATNANSNGTIAVTGTGQQYFKLTRTGNTYQAAVSLDGGATYVAASPQTFTAGLPDTVYVGFIISSASATASASATFSDVHVRDGTGTEIIGPDEFTGEIGGGTSGNPGGGGGTPPPGSTHADDQSRGATPAEPALLTGSVARYNVEGFAAASVTGGGDIPGHRRAIARSPRRPSWSPRCAPRRRRAPTRSRSSKS